MLQNIWLFVKGVNVIWKALGVIALAVGVGWVAKDKVGTIIEAPTEVEVLAGQVQALDSTIHDFRDFTQARFKVLEDSISEGNRRGVETRCIVIAHAARKPVEQILEECLQ